MSLMIGLNEEGKCVGESHGRCKLSNKDVDDIRDLREEYGVHYHVLAETYDVSVSTIFDICNYKTRCQTPVKWKRRKEKVKVSGKAN